jgi:curved DNA-binding protein CbpA
MTKDYYRILGVLDDAEDIVIRAAYKVLAQKYHPDKWKGDKEEATRRMSEINEAYGVLSDVEKRKQYDSTRDKAEYQEDANEEDNSDFDKSLEEDWKSATEYFPDLIELAGSLAKFSYKLEYTFKVIIIEQKAFNNRIKLAKNIEDNFLRKYFGTNQQILKFAKELIFRNQKDAAKELNKAVNLLGSEVDPNIIIQKIEKKFTSLETYQLIERIKNFTASAEDLIFVMEKVTVSKVRVFCGIFAKSYSYSFIWSDKHYSMNQEEFNIFVIDNIIPILKK